MCPNNDGIFVQAGIVAWGIGCGTNGVPGGYVNVASFTCWIKRVIENVEGRSGLPIYDECAEYSVSFPIHIIHLKAASQNE